MSDAKALKYGDRPMTTAALAFKNGEDAATVRLGDEKDIQPGDMLSQQNQMGGEFGRAEVVDVITCPVHAALYKIQKRGARYPITGVESLMETLAEYYERALTERTGVKIIIYCPTALASSDGSLLRRESPKEGTPDGDVTCSDCGADRTLIGPLNFDGEVMAGADMVCPGCADSRGLELKVETEGDSDG